MEGKKFKQLNKCINKVLLQRVVGGGGEMKKIQFFWPLAIKIFDKRGDKRAKNKKSLLNH